MEIISEEKYIDLSILKKRYEEGDDVALDYYVIHSIKKEKEFPEWVLDGLYERSQKSIKDNTKKILEEERYKSLIMAAVIAAKHSDFVPRVGKFRLAELLLSVTNVHTKLGKPFNKDNIERTYRRIKTGYEVNQEDKSNENFAIHDDALGEFILILESLQVDVSNDITNQDLNAKLELQLLAMPRINLPF